jgi:hypothetical protein
VAVGELSRSPAVGCRRELDLLRRPIRCHETRNADARGAGAAIEPSPAHASRVPVRLWNPGSSAGEQRRRDATSVRRLRGLPRLQRVRPAFDSQRRAPSVTIDPTTEEGLPLRSIRNARMRLRS